MCPRQPDSHILTLYFSRSLCRASGRIAREPLACRSCISTAPLVHLPADHLLVVVALVVLLPARLWASRNAEYRLRTDSPI
jgi:hypothetical protein